jgi:16S rRNA (cytidine1402-2'-O)-methyltransferase
MTVSKGKLYLVATPIGNLEDITLRALRVLKEADLIACEDTRHTQKLLNHFDIHKRTISYHEHNEHTRAAELIKEMEEGSTVALVSDAGTPTISDPGQRLVALCIERGIGVIPLPGASAILSALSAAGMPADRFLFVGFLPARQGERRRALSKLAQETCALVLYEAPHRLAAMLSDVAEILGPRPAAIARELTKVHEEFIRGTLNELAARANEAPIKGEITLVIGPGTSQRGNASAKTTTLRERVADLVATGKVDRKGALKQAAHEFGLPKREAYKRLLLEGDPGDKTEES